MQTYERHLKILNRCYANTALAVPKTGTAIIILPRYFLFTEMNMRQAASICWLNLAPTLKRWV